MNSVKHFYTLVKYVKYVFESIWSNNFECSLDGENQPLIELGVGTHWYIAKR